MDKKCCIDKKSSHDEEFKKKLNNRLNRINGQISGIKKMIESDTYCDNVLIQISSAKAALDGVSKLLLEAHLKSCVKEEILNGNDEAIDDLMKVLKKMIK